ncbi:MAG: SMP-30/gluconolactonase/LRE family protein [Chloroflexi bacterium]|nr:SMP-30/gluconolactonase/LRE family protein [Chloroflexota bacterium]
MPARTPQVLLDDIMFAEGPRWHQERLWFSDMYAHEVVAVDMAGRRESIATVPNQPSGLGFLPDGRLLIVSMKDRRLLRLDASGLTEVADLSGLATAECNDMVVDGQGRAYVGNLGFDVHVGAPARPANIVLVTPEGDARIVAEDLAIPNGTVITPDGRTLIVGESRGKRLTAFDVEPDGSLTNRRIWAELAVVPDGICLDAEGCIWIGAPGESGGYLRIAQGGEVIDRVDPGDAKAIACMLGGPDGRTLFMCDAVSARPSEIEGPGNSRIRTVEVDAPRAGWP